LFASSNDRYFLISAFVDSFVNKKTVFLLLEFKCDRIGLTFLGELNFLSEILDSKLEVLFSDIYFEEGTFLKRNLEVSSFPEHKAKHLALGPVC
jgi:hypothetical protein